MQCDSKLSGLIVKKFKDYTNASKITHKQRTTMLSIENKIYKYLYVFVDDIGTNLWTPR